MLAPPRCRFASAARPARCRCRRAPASPAGRWRSPSPPRPTSSRSPASAARRAAPAFGADAARFGSVGSNRYAYWRVAVDACADHPLEGVGAGGFRVEWLARRPFAETVRDAHSLELETLAELGLVGLALPGAAVRRRRSPRARRAADPALAAGPAAALAVWAVHSGVDWDWEMPALTLVAVVLAGAVLGADPGSSVRAGPSADDRVLSLDAADRGESDRSEHAQ